MKTEIRLLINVWLAERVALGGLTRRGSGTLIDKLPPSRRPRRPGRPAIRSAFLLTLLATIQPALALNLSRGEALRIGKKIWQNECAGTVAGLTSWNQGEKFASLGIGHFIWYPRGARGPFDESFPKLLAFVSARGVKLPQILLGDGAAACPWNSRAEFQQALQTTEMKQLRQFLAETVEMQAEFLVQRLEQALAQMLAKAPAAEHASLQRRFARVAGSAAGCYALVDYVNFKGEGALDSEKYNGQGWGLLQVLEHMSRSENEGAALQAFAASARQVLSERVRNSPPARQESRWLNGWLQRINTYTEF